jgi:hypothetical protein
MMAVHVAAPYRINLGLADLLKAGAPSDIIHLGDYVSGRGSKKHIAYAASKAAQDNLTLSFAALLAPDVKVNSIAPALVLFNEDDDAAYREKTLRKSLMQREGGLDEMQHQVDYLTGRISTAVRIRDGPHRIHMDGGRDPPGLNLSTLTLFLAAYFVASGILQIVAGFGARPEPGWGLVAFGGVVSLVLGVIIWRQFPISGIWAVGTLVGIQLLFSGWTLIAVGGLAKRAVQAAEEHGAS